MSKSFIVNRHSAATPSLEPIQSEKIPVYDTVADAENDLANLNVGQIIATKEVEKSLFDYIYPIGSTYTQYPNCVSPNILWPDTEWTEIDYQGAFFRASGGNAQAFDNQTSMQNAQLPKIVGTSAVAGLYPGRGTNSGAISQGGTTSGMGGGSDLRYNFTFDSSRSGASSDIRGRNVYTANGETRPANYTIKIWKRTA